MKNLNFLAGPLPVLTHAGCGLEGSRRDAEAQSLLSTLDRLVEKIAQRRNGATFGNFEVVRLPCVASLLRCASFLSCSPTHNFESTAPLRLCASLLLMPTALEPRSTSLKIA